MRKCDLKSQKATLFNIQRFSLNDGSGIRTTVFFKGCNFKCAWCHNPESFSSVPQISVDHNKCTNCRKCETACENKVHIFNNNSHTINEEACTHCLSCVDICPSKAISVIGKEWTIEETVSECMKDKMYYQKDNGGVTFSGGEATLQYDFLLELAKSLKELGIHTCLETNGALSSKKLTELSKYIDVFLFDFKHYDDNLHKKYIGSSNKIVFESLQLLGKLNKNVVLRCPIIPNINDCDQHFDMINSLKQKYKNISKVELMPYHSIGTSKWNNLSMDYSLEKTVVPDEAMIEKWKSKIKN